MDILLVNGDHYLDSRGLPVTLTGEQEKIQQALIRLSIRRGTFPLDPELGGRLYLLQKARAQDLNRLALSYAADALASMKGVEVVDALVKSTQGQGLEVTLSLRVEGKIYPLEIPVDGGSQRRRG